VGRSASVRSRQRRTTFLMAARTGEARTRRVVNLRSGGDEKAGLCERCGKHGTTIHHRKKRSQGGPWSSANCVALCGHGTAGCHGWVEANPLAAHVEGFYVRSYEDETTRQVLTVRGWAYLGDAYVRETA
jgi:hypothetical protein